MEEPPPGPWLHDPDLDVPRARAPRVPDLLPGEVQRLVANPFLVLVGLVAWSLALRMALRAKNLPLTLVLFALVGGAVFLLQYHCLDCGKTGWLFRWRAHECDRVRARRLAGRPLRFRLPRPTTQMALWFYLLVLVALLAVIVLGEGYFTWGIPVPGGR